MTNTTPTRDDRLGEALRELVVPEHGVDFHRELRERLAGERTRAVRRRRLRWGAPVAVAAAAAVALFLVALPTTHQASAALVQAKLRSALGSLESLRGTLATDGKRWSFVTDARGDFRLEGPTPGEVITYDAAAGVVRSAQHSASLGGDTLFYAERDGVAPGAPDIGPPTWLLPERLGAYVRAALAADDPRVRTVGDTWQLDVDGEPNRIVPELSGDHLAITVDRVTGLPTHVVESRRGRVLHDLRIGDLVVDAQLPADTFRLGFPPDAEVMRSDDGFRRVALDDVARAVGYRPLVPTRVPAGFELATVAVATEAAPTGKEGANPPSRRVVSLEYRRGLDVLLVTTRLRGNGRWDDPLATGEGFVDRPTPVTIAGTTWQLLVAPRALPHLWALTGDLVVTVGGDLSAAELKQVAAALAPR
jgi:hypothetical protein